MRNVQATSVNEWLLLSQARGRRQLRASPADELAALDAHRVAADTRGDSARVEAIDARLDELFQEARGAATAERREASAAMRFASGTRTPLKKKLAGPQAMDRTLLRITGRIR